MPLAPVDRAAAHRLLRGAKFFPLMGGARGRPKLDVAGSPKSCSASPNAPVQSRRSSAST